MESLVTSPFLSLYVCRFRQNINSSQFRAAGITKVTGSCTLEASPLLQTNGATITSSFHKLIIYSKLADSRRCPGIYNLSFYNLCDQLLPSIYPWLRNRCLAINNSSLLVSSDMSHVPVTWQRSGWNIHISFCPLGRMPHFSLLILFLILTQSGKRRK
jgi:hypothetical protein